MRGNEFVELQAFVAISRHGSFVRTAEELQISPSALSQTIRALEQRIGVRLLNRTRMARQLSSLSGKGGPIAEAPSPKNRT